MILIFGALASLVLGVGMTVSACYIFLAIVLAPAIIEAGVTPIAAHLYVLYWGVLSFITPPVAIAAITASTISNPSTSIFKDFNFSPVADWELLSKAAKIAKAKNLRTHIGGIYSSDVFYDERPDLTKEMVRHGILAVEMETAELYTLAARYNRKALSILTASDHLITKKELPSTEREKSFSSMVELALRTAFGE